jgi:hypothetical protein
MDPFRYSVGCLDGGLPHLKASTYVEHYNTETYGHTSVYPKVSGLSR